jgi:hypothetical protein
LENLGSQRLLELEGGVLAVPALVEGGLRAVTIDLQPETFNLALTDFLGIHP